MYINGTFLDSKITAPYIFNAEPFAGQRVTLKIVQYSSMVSMFGATDEFPRKTELSTNRINDSSLTFGLDEIVFCQSKKEDIKI